MEAGAVLGTPEWSCMGNHMGVPAPKEVHDQAALIATSGAHGNCRRADLSCQSRRRSSLPAHRGQDRRSARDAVTLYMSRESQFDYQRGAETARKAQTDFNNYSLKSSSNPTRRFQNRTERYIKSYLPNLELSVLPPISNLLQEMDTAWESAFQRTFGKLRALRTGMDAVALEAAM